MVQLIPVLLETVAAKLLNTALSGDDDKKKEVIKEAIAPIHEAIAEAVKTKPWYKSSRNLGGWATIILLMFNKKIGLDLSMEEIIAITGLMGLLIGAKTVKN